MMSGGQVSRGRAMKKSQGICGSVGLRTSGSDKLPGCCGKGPARVPGRRAYLLQGHTKDSKRQKDSSW